MCYELFISTNQIAKSLIKSDYVEIKQATPAETSQIPPQYRREYIYYVASKSKCSCTFRYWESNFDFQPPQDWANEYLTDDNIIGTQKLYEAITASFPPNTSLLLLTHWYGEDYPTSQSDFIKLSTIDKDNFLIYTDKIMQIVV